MPGNHAGGEDVIWFMIMKCSDGLDRTISRVYVCDISAYHLRLPHLEVWPTGAFKILDGRHLYRS